MKTAAKQAAGKAAADLVQDEMTVGLGTGSTAACAIDALILRCQQGLKIKAVATSQASYNQAFHGGIPMINPNDVFQLDLTIDGADEIDPEKRMIKGGGGALLKEKITAFSSQEMIVVVDASKCVDQLGRFPLPLEIAPFAYQATMMHLRKLGYNGTLRKTGYETFITENGNYIYDVQNHPLFDNPEEIDKFLHTIPGIIETGFFFDLAGRVVIGYEDGRVEIRD